MTQNPSPVNTDIWLAWLNGVPQPITNATWITGTLLYVAITHDAQDGDILTMQCPRPDSTIYDLDGCVCLGFGPIFDTYLVGFSPIGPPGDS